MLKILFEIYSTGMALGYIKRDVKTSVQGVPKTYERPFKNGRRTHCTPIKNRIDKVMLNADIKPVLHGTKKYLTESQLYDFMLDAEPSSATVVRGEYL